MSRACWLLPQLAEVAQVAGLLTDNFALKRMYVASEALNLVLAVAMFACGQHHSRMLFALNVGLGLLFAFSQPVTKSMPPAVADSREDLAIINGWDLTCDKIGRYLAPFAYAVVSSSYGFKVAVFLSCLLYSLLAVLRTLVRVEEPPSRKQATNGESRPTVGQKLRGLLQQIVDGVTSLKRDRVLQLLIINTLVPWWLRRVGGLADGEISRVAERADQLDLSVFDYMLQRVMFALDIKKKDMWRNYNALVSLGGVAGPFLSNALIYMLEAYSTNHKACQLWVGVNFGITSQIATMALLAVVVMLSGNLGAGSLVFNLVGAWILMIAVNNIVTTYFNSISQERLQHKERGRFIANIMTIFNLGSICGSLLFGWVLSAYDNSVTGSVSLLICGLVIKSVLLVLLRKEGNGTFAGESFCFVSLARLKWNRFFVCEAPGLLYQWQPVRMPSGNGRMKLKSKLRSCAHRAWAMVIE
ncbi:unnamed protein product [Cladocopium goreaui]|uniref:SNF1-like protein kinase ssp2 n=1 Tax=Cladocopium goreaui TaxID=2562237 RepID=A0A9P1BHK6_9DINO|nr:unnamed protein product [Cladocopium goreaui]